MADGWVGRFKRKASLKPDWNLTNLDWNLLYAISTIMLTAVKVRVSPKQSLRILEDGRVLPQKAISCMS